jgi:hypothetical protein
VVTEDAVEAVEAVAVVVEAMEDAKAGQVEVEVEVAVEVEVEEEEGVAMAATCQYLRLAAASKPASLAFRKPWRQSCRLAPLVCTL